MINHKLFVSVDMDDWYFARWATGSSYSLWENVESCFKELYNSTSPPETLHKPTEKILQLFDDLNFKSTFFFTGWMANAFPDLVKTISSQGHEIGCHNYHHLDYEYIPREKFKEDLKKSKGLLEELSGQAITGYRSPNSSIPQNLVADLIESGFKYDSSVTPTRRLMGKFGKFTKAPRRPYRPGYGNLGLEGDAGLVELPWAVFPFFKLPSGSGITHRIAGKWYNQLAVTNSLKKGHTAYYFHPYEIADMETIRSKLNLPLKSRIFLRNCGDVYFAMLSQFLKEHQTILINGNSLFELVYPTLTYKNSG